MQTNIHIYLAIAKEALAKSQETEAANRTPRPDGSPGHIIAYDPTKTSFKQSLIAIVFAGTYLDALLYIEGQRRLVPSEFTDFEYRKYEIKLQTLGINDPDILSECKRFRESRNDIAHEKACELDKMTDINLRIAQHEAAHALQFVEKISRLLEQSSKNAAL